MAVSSTRRRLFRDYPRRQEASVPQGCPKAKSFRVTGARKPLMSLKPAIGLEPMTLIPQAGEAPIDCIRGEGIPRPGRQGPKVPSGGLPSRLSAGPVKKPLPFLNRLELLSKKRGRGSTKPFRSITSSSRGPAVFQKIPGSNYADRSIPRVPAPSDQDREKSWSSPL